MPEHMSVHIALRGEKVLKLRAEEVEDPTALIIKQLAKDMLIAMKTHNGVGIAAPQVRVSKRVIIVHSQPNSRYPDAPAMEPIIMINPQVLVVSEDMETSWEGCLSLPGLRGLIPRHKEVQIEYTTLSNQKEIITLSGFPARIFQHEYDHLEGVLFPERAKSALDIYSEQEYHRRVSHL